MYTSRFTSIVMVSLQFEVVVLTAVQVAFCSFGANTPSTWARSLPCHRSMYASWIPAE
ncbi:hypothetical protein RKD19_004584 [Streptomyces canus]